MRTGGLATQIARAPADRGLTKPMLTTGNTPSNTQHTITALLRQSVFALRSSDKCVRVCATETTTRRITAASYPEPST